MSMHRQGFEDALHEAWDEGRDPFADPAVQRWLAEHPGDVDDVLRTADLLRAVGAGGEEARVAAGRRRSTRTTAAAAVAAVAVALAAAVVLAVLVPTGRAHGGGGEGEGASAVQFPRPRVLSVGSDGFLGVQRFAFEPRLEGDGVVEEVKVNLRARGPDGSVAEAEWLLARLR